MGIWPIFGVQTRAVMQYNVIVRLNTASAEDQRLLLHCCLFSPAHQFANVVFTREANAGLCRNQTIKMASKTTRRAHCQAVEKQSVHCLPSDPNVRKEWINFIFNEVPVLRTWSFIHLILAWICLRTRHNSTLDFQKRFKLKDAAVLAILDPTVATLKSE